MQSNFGELITNLCKKAGSDEKFAHQFGVSLSTVRRWKKGELPSLPIFQKLVDQYQLEIIIKP